MTLPGRSDPRRRLAATELYLVASVQADRSEHWLPRLARAVEAGVGAVQLRCKGQGTAALRAALDRTRETLGDRVVLIVNDDLEAALTGQAADGVHLGREDAARMGSAAPLPPGLPQDHPDLRRAWVAGLARARSLLGPGRLLGTSTRTRDEVDLARSGGADHAGFGAMASSSTKRDTRPADPAALGECLTLLGPDWPLFPIGGLEPGTLPGVVAQGARRAAVGRYVLEADDPAAAVAACLACLRAPDVRPR